MNAGVALCPRCDGVGVTGRLVLCLVCGYHHEEICPRCLGVGYLGVALQPLNGGTR